MEDLVIKDFSEVEIALTEYQKYEVEQMIKKYYPPGTPEIMCVSEVKESEKYLELVNLKDFK